MDITWLLFLLPIASAAIGWLLLNKQHTLAAYLSTASVIATFVISVSMLLAGKDTQASFNWASVGDFHVKIGFMADQMARGMMIVVTGVGMLVHVFSLPYMKKDAAKARYFACLSLFMFSMTGIVLSDNFLMTFMFWELVGLSSYLLIGHWYQKESAADAAKKAFLTNRIGDFGFMIGILMIWGIAGSVSFAGIADWASHVGTLTPLMTATLGAATLCIFCGAIGKSAQMPLHVWLPDAMEGPTPVSALIHAATMVAAGIFMMVRFFTCFETGEAHGAPEADHAAVSLIPSFAWTTIAVIGIVTSLAAAFMATQQDDIKKILAYSTLSQLGYMVMAVGLQGSEASMFHLYTHAWFKALLFLGSGAVIYACHHEQNIWKMGGLLKKMPITAITFLIATLALAGFPMTAGFFSKEQILHVANHQGGMLFFIPTVLVAILTTFYMFRLVFVVFFGKNRSENAEHAHEVGPLMFIPLIALTVMAVIAGYEGIAGQMAPLFHHEKVNFGSIEFLSSIGAFIVGLVLAFVFYFNKDEDKLSGNVLSKVFANKFYIDEFYAKLVRVFQDAVAAVVHFFDEILIGGILVGGLSRSAAGFGALFRRLHSGNLQGYATLFGAGALLIIYLTVFVF